MAVIGLDTVKENLISDLMELSAVQITDQSAKLTDDSNIWRSIGAKDGDDSAAADLELKLNQTSLALETLEKYSTAKSPLFTTRRAVKKADFAKTIKGRQQIYSDVQHVLTLNDSLHKLREKVNKLYSELSSIKPWVVYDLPLEVQATAYTMTAEKLWSFVKSGGTRI
mgnify:CR=1 FL=1